MSRLTKVKLHGILAEKYGTDFEFALEVPADIIRAMQANFPDFKTEILKLEAEGYGYRLVLGDTLDGSQDLDYPDLVTYHTSDTLHLIPTLEGSGAVGRILGGAALIIGGLFTGGLTTQLGAALIGVGASLALGGVAELFTPKVSVPSFNSNREDDGTQNTIFGAGNGISSFRYGIPLVYGEVRIRRPAILSSFSRALAPADRITVEPILETRLVERETYVTKSVALRKARKALIRDVLDVVLEYETVQVGTRTLAYPRYEVRDKLKNTTFYSVMAAVSEGEIEGAITNPIGRSIFIDDTPLVASNGADNFPGDKNYFWSSGRSDQVLVNYTWDNSTVEEVAVGADLDLNSSVTRTVTGDYYAVGIKILIQQLLNIDNDKGEINNNVMRIRVEQSTDSQPYETEFEILYDAKTQQPFEQTFDFNLLVSESKSWDIRVTKFEGDEESEKKPAVCQWASYYVVDPSKEPDFPNLSVCFVELDASNLGRQPELALDVKGLKISCPNNYTPGIMGYTATPFNGTFSTWGYTNNPAYILLDLLTNTRYGCGISQSNIDLYSFYEAGVYCDSYVRDGDGGREKRYVFNGALVQRQDALKAVRAIAGMMNAYLVYSNNKIRLIQDRPKSVVWAFNPTNVVVEVSGDGEESPPFQYSQANDGSRYTAADITYLEPFPDWQEETLEIADNTLIGQYGFKAFEGAAFGCTSKGQAIRYGRWQIFTSNYNDQFVKFRAAREVLPLEVGDIIEIYDYYEQGVQLAGRVVSQGAGLNQVIVDRILFGSNVGKLFVFLYKNGQRPSANITNIEYLAGDQTLVTYSDNIPTTEADGFYIFRTDVAPTKWQILTIQQDDEEIYSIEAVNYRSDKWNYIENGYTLPQLNTSWLTSTPEIPYNLKVKVVPALDSSLTKIVGKVYIDWANTDTVVQRIAYYEVRYRGTRFNGEYTQPQRVEARSYYFDAEFDYYEFQVRSVTALGFYSPWATTNFNVDYDLGIPEDVKVFSLDPRQTNIADLSWSSAKAIDVRLLGFLRLKFSANNLGWARAQVLGEYPGTSTGGIVPLLEGTYYAKWVDPYGKESLNAVTITTSNLNLFDKNLIATFSEHPTWAGTKTNMVNPDGTDYITMTSTVLFDDPLEVFDDQIGLFDEVGQNELNTEGLYYFDNRLVVSTVQDVEIISTFDYIFFNLGAELFDSTPGVFDDRQGLFDGSISGSSEVYLEVRTSQDGATFGEWQQLKQTILNFLEAEFRIRVLTDGTVNIQIDEATITADVKDREERGSVVTNAGGDTVVTFSRPFVIAPPNGIGYSVQSGTTEDQVEITNVTTTGFTINIYQSSSRISRTVYWFTESY